jgi:hypothetical protein
MRGNEPPEPLIEEFDERTGRRRTRPLSEFERELDAREPYPSYPLWPVLLGIVIVIAVAWIVYLGFMR